MTVGVYGLVAGIVKLDDLGQHFAERGRRSGALAGLQTALARAILLSAPWLMKGLSVAGTIAMFLVGGGILTHAVPALHDFVHHQAESIRQVPGFGPVLAVLVAMLVDFVAGVAAGLLALLAWSGVKRLRPGKSASAIK